MAEVHRTEHLSDRETEVLEVELRSEFGPSSVDLDE